MQQILTSYENEMFLHRDNLMIYESLFRSEIGISNRKLVFAYLDEQKKCSCLSITEGEIDSSKLLYDVICSKLKEEQIINIQYMNCVGLSCLILILLMKNNEYNINFLLSNFNWPNFNQSRKDTINFIMSILKSCDYNIIITSNFETSIRSYIKEINELKDEEDEIYRVYNKLRNENINILLFSNSILIYSILLNKYGNDYEINNHLRSKFDCFFDRSIVERCIDEIKNYFKPILKIIGDNIIQKRRISSPITILSCGDNNTNYSLPRKIRKIDSDLKINICDFEDIDYLNNNSEDDSLCSLFC